MPPNVTENGDVTTHSSVTYDLISPVSRQLESSLPKKPCVSFSRQIRVKEIQHINDVKRQIDIRNIWFSKIELLKIRLKCKEIIEHMNEIDRRSIYDVVDDYQHQDEQTTSIVVDDEKMGICTRGLEKYTKLRRDNCRLRRKNAVMAVLQEQEFQRSMGILEPEIIARVYEQNTYDRQNTAHISAVQTATCQQSIISDLLLIE